MSFLEGSTLVAKQCAVRECAHVVHSKQLLENTFTKALQNTSLGNVKRRACDYYDLLLFDTSAGGLALCCQFYLGQLSRTLCAIKSDDP